MSITPEKILGWVALVAVAALAWVYRDTILAFLGGGTSTTQKTTDGRTVDPCADPNLTGLQRVGCMLTTFALGDIRPKAAANTDAVTGRTQTPEDREKIAAALAASDLSKYLPTSGDVRYGSRLNLTPNSPSANAADPGLTLTAAALVAKLNAGTAFTTTEWAYMKNNEPTLYRLAGGYAGADPNANAPVGDLTPLGYPRTQPAPAPQKTDLTKPLPSCSKCQILVREVTADPLFVPDMGRLNDCCPPGSWVVNQGQIAPACADSFSAFQRWAQNNPGKSVFCTEGMIGNM